MQRIGLDKLAVAVGGAKLVGKGALHVDGIIPYPPPRTGFVEAIGPAGPAVVPAAIPRDAQLLVMVSVRPAAVFNQANLAFAAASPVDQALFFTHLRSLESQLNKRFADDALGVTPRVWSLYHRNQETISILEVADVALVRTFLERYADALQVLSPGAKIERTKVGKRDVIAVTVPGGGTLAIAFDAGTVVIGPSTNALTAHFSAKGRKATTLAPSAVAWSTATSHTAEVTHILTLTNDGFHVASDAKRR
jgi:hypothetical protein